MFKSALLKIIYSKIDLAFYPGERSKAYFKKYGVEKSKLRWLPHAIDNNRFSEPRLEKARAIRENLGLKETDILFLFAGKLDNNKNPEILVRAFEQVQLENAYLLIVGNGEKEVYLRSLVTDHRIYFADFQNQGQLPEYYQACDVFCLPSKSETWGLGVNEAMSCGKAILISDKVGCGPDLVENGENGYIFKSNDQHDLADKMAALNDRKKIDIFGRNSLRKIADFSFSKQVEIISEELRKI
ncbi:MAG: glycosyltransferase family 1 protein [Sphingobacteriales bacterium]|nr:MAG: glycosyltransferase family 1 protein [Sphingobacteriales bacterium]